MPVALKRKKVRTRDLIAVAFVLLALLFASGLGDHPLFR